MAIITIPFDYDPIKHNGALVPIFLNDTDEKGKRIHFGWIEAVIPIHGKLVTLASRVLGDAWRASEVTDLSLHHLWHKYGARLGTDPSRRVYQTARRKAYGLEDPAARVHLGKNIALDELDGFYRNTLASASCDMEAKIDHDRSVERFLAKLHELGSEEQILVYQKLNSGYAWREIGKEVDENANTVHRRFKRLLKQIKDTI